MSWWGHTFMPDYYLRNIPRGDDELPAPLEWRMEKILVTEQDRKEYEEWLDSARKGVPSPSQPHNMDAKSKD